MRLLRSFHHFLHWFSCLLLVASGALGTEIAHLRVSVLPGQGVQAEGMKVNTGIQTDLAIDGPGVFLVRDPMTDARQMTRAGLFLLDRDGYLVTYDRWRVQGWSDAALSVEGDVQLDGQQRPVTSDPSAHLVAFAFRSDGALRVILSDGTEFIRGQVGRYQVSGITAQDPSSYGRYALGGTRIERFPDIGSVWLRAGSLERIHLTENLVLARELLHFELQGSLLRTGNPLDLAVSGRGYLLLRDPLRDELVAARTVSLERDPQGYLIDGLGRRLQGVSNLVSSLVGDIQADTDGRPPAADPSATFAGFSLEQNGMLQVRLSDGFEFSRAQVLLQRFREPFNLKSGSGGAFINLAAAVPVEPAAPGSKGNGILQAGAKELPFDLVEVTPLSQGGFRVLVTGEPGVGCAIERSSDLVVWEMVGSLSLSHGEAEFRDPRVLLPGSKFYRARVMPVVPR